MRRTIGRPTIGTRRGRRAATRVLLVALLAGCGDDSGPVEPLGPCDTAVTLAASSAQVPQFTWSPPCGVARLTVTAPPAGGAPVVYWSITSLTSAIGSGVRYASLPAGAILTEGPRALVPGQTLGVTVHDQSGVQIGSASFTVP